MYYVVSFLYFAIYYVQQHTLVQVTFLSKETKLLRLQNERVSFINLFKTFKKKAYNHPSTTTSIVVSVVSGSRWVGEVGQQPHPQWVTAET